MYFRVFRGKTIRTMYNDPFEFKYNPKGDYYDLVVDKKIQKVVDELKQLPHEVLIRYMTYWIDDVEIRQYEVESDLPHEEWYADCQDYASSTTDEERYMHAKCMAETLGHMLQDIKYYHPNKYPTAMRTVKSWKKYRFIGFSATMKEEIDKAWIEPVSWEDGKKAAYAYVPLLATFMKYAENGRIFESSYTNFEDLMNGDVDKDTFAWGYEYLVCGPSAFVTECLS